MAKSLMTNSRGDNDGGLITFDATFGKTNLTEESRDVLAAPRKRYA
jgi:hypothetical protein